MKCECCGTVLEVSEDKKRTIKQNSAMHKYFNLLAKALNESGMTVSKTLKAEVQWSDTAVKEYLWKPFQQAVTNKKSTTKLKTDEVAKIYDNLNLYLSERLGVSVEFPNND